MTVIATTATVSEARACLDAHRRGEPCGFTVDADTGCWLWDELPESGLGPFLAFYEAAYGAPPPAFTVAHRCRGAWRGCVRPAHLDTVAPGMRVRPFDDRPVVDGWARAIAEEREARGQDRRTFAHEL